MTEEIDAIMFDLGGTLIDLKPSREEVFASVLSRHGKAVDPKKVAVALAKADATFDKDIARLDGKDEDSFWEKYDSFVLEQVGAKVDLDKFAPDVSSTFEQIMPKVDSWAAYPEARPILEGLSKRDFRLGVISNATELARKVMDNLNLTELFDFVIISSEVGVSKPSPRIFQMGLEKARTRANRSLFVGDKPSLDVLPAISVGMHAVLVDRTNAYPNCPCLRVKDLNFFKRFL